jgi:hypothetical protein
MCRPKAKQRAGVGWGATKQLTGRQPVFEDPVSQLLVQRIAIG